MLSGRSRRMSAIVAGAAHSPLTVSNASNHHNSKLSEKELKQLFDECLKVAAENKINANNSWSLGLIEYFHDLTYLKDGDTINFQKASCTLDGCVKIYTSRVDFVDSETKKLMSGLADKDDQSLLEDEDGTGLHGGDGSSGNTKQNRRKPHVPGNTLESNVDKLNSQKFDLEFRVDPLFKKTCADFDEGGARGLLLNHLSLGLDGKIVFDATDDQDQLVSDEMKLYDTSLFVDVSTIQEKFHHVLEKIDYQDVCPSLKSFQFNETNNFFDPQRYLENAQELLQQVPSLQDDDDQHSVASGVGMDYMMGGDGVFDHGTGWDMQDGGMFHGDDMDHSQNPLSQTNPIPMIIKQMNEYRRKSTRLSLTPGELGDENQVVEWAQDDNQHHAMFSYFDKALIKNWMGPEMWRARAIRDRSTSDNQISNVAEGSAVGTKKKKTRGAIEIDFSTPVDEQALFARSNASIDLPKSQQASKNPHLLPEDLQFTSKDFLSLFLKPQQMIKFRKRILSGDPTSVDLVEEDEAVERQEKEFWAQNEVEQQDMMMGADYEQDFYGNQAGFNSDFDDDDDDDEPIAVPVFSSFDPLQQSSQPGEQNLPSTQDSSLYPSSSQLFDLSSTQQPLYLSSDWRSQLVSEPRKVKTQFVNYARVAKKVDVKKLKENLWTSLNHQQKSLDPNAESQLPSFTHSSPTFSSDPDTIDESKIINHDTEPSSSDQHDLLEEHQISQPQQQTQPKPNDDLNRMMDEQEQVIPFTQVVQDLKPHYSDKKWKDISVAFCFICLLHLANENDLEILPTSSEYVSSLDEDTLLSKEKSSMTTGKMQNSERLKKSDSSVNSGLVNEDEQFVLTKGVNTELLIKKEK